MTFLRMGGETRRMGLRLYLIEMMPLLKRGCLGSIVFETMPEPLPCLKSFFLLISLLADVSSRWLLIAATTVFEDDDVPLGY